MTIADLDAGIAHDLGDLPEFETRPKTVGQIREQGPGILVVGVSGRGMKIGGVAKQQPTQRTLVGTGSLPPPHNELVLGTGERHIQQAQVITGNLHCGPILALIGSQTIKVPRHTRGGIDHAHHTLVVVHGPRIWLGGPRSLGIGHQHHGVLQTLGRMDRGDLHRPGVTINPTCFVVCLAAVGHQDVQGVTHCGCGLVAAVEAGVEQFNNMLKVGESAFGLTGAGNGQQHIGLGTQLLEEPHDAKVLEVHGPPQTSGLQTLNPGVVKQHVQWLVHEPAHRQCPDPTGVTMVGQRRQQDAQLPHHLGLEHVADATAHHRDVSLLEFGGDGLGVVMAAHQHADVPGLDSPGIP